ncbi:MAG TPA: acyl-CoA desaturase [Bdellovibrio sp.]|nr:acyl-CoA desaturase [Bdellovibrio sp.]
MNTTHEVKTLSKVNILRIVLFHLSALSVFYVGVSWTAFVIFFLSFFIRTFGVSAGYHRYFSHRSFKTSRFFQFVLAFLGASAGQKGPLSWATSHRIHHRTSDTQDDPHTPKKGFFYGYLGWLLPVGALHTDLNLTADFARYPEIRWINKFHNIGPLTVILTCGFLGKYLRAHFPELNTNAFQLIVWGFILSTLATLHGTLMVNTICHSEKKPHQSTHDFSRNVPWLLPFTLGENWHHNHHRYPKSANCGLEKNQIDFIYLGIRLLEKLGIVSEVNTKTPSEISNA